MSITKLYSVDIFVNDQDKAIDFYVNKLGFEKRTDEPADDKGNRWIEVVPPNSDIALILAHGFGHWSPERVGGYTGLIFNVEDMASTVKSLKAKGVTFEGEVFSDPHGTYAHVQDPDGNVSILHDVSQGEQG
mgnify:CR=1 FL=1